MQISGIDTNVSTNFEQKVGGGFKINANGQSFKILSSSIYEHKIAAIVRELCANAADAHKAAGNSDQPFSVVIPNDFHPYFEVEDFGVGMSLEMFTEVYTTYFGSTKSGDNDAIGGFGLGSKTPFAYTKQFTVRTRQNGREHTALIYMDKTGAPYLDVVSSIDTTEPNGTKVTVPVSPNDYREFEGEASYFLSFYPVKPILNCDLTFMYDGVGPALENSDSAYVSRTQNGLQAALARSSFYVVMGPVAYPVDVMSFVTDQTTKAFLQHGMNSAANTHSKTQALFMRFGIGELEVAASRESLSLEEDTKQLIVERFTKAAREKAAELKALACDETKHPLDIISEIYSTYGSYGSFLEMAKKVSPRLERFIKKTFVFPRLCRYTMSRWEKTTSYRKATFAYNQTYSQNTLEIRQIDTDKPQHKTLFHDGMLVYKGIMTETMKARIERILQVEVRLTKYSDVYEAYLAERRANRAQGAYVKYEKTNIAASGFRIRRSPLNSYDENGNAVNTGQFKGDSYSFNKTRVDIDPSNTFYVDMRETRFPEGDLVNIFNIMVMLDETLNGILIVRINDQNKGKIVKAGIKELEILINQFAEDFSDEIGKTRDAQWWDALLNSNQRIGILLDAKSRLIPKYFLDFYEKRTVHKNIVAGLSASTLNILQNSPLSDHKKRDNFKKFVKKNLETLIEKNYPVCDLYMDYRTARGAVRQELIDIIQMLDTKHAAKAAEGDEDGQ